MSLKAQVRTFCAASSLVIGSILTIVAFSWITESHSRQVTLGGVILFVVALAWFLWGFWAALTQDDFGSWN